MGLRLRNKRFFPILLTALLWAVSAIAAIALAQFLIRSAFGFVPGPESVLAVLVVLTALWLVLKEWRRQGKGAPPST